MNTNLSVPMVKPCDFHPGQRVFWQYVQRSGYRWGWSVPATVREVTAKRVVIDAYTVTGGYRTVRVKPTSLLIPASDAAWKAEWCSKEGKL